MNMNTNMNTKAIKRKSNTTRIQIKSKAVDSNTKAKVILSKIDDMLYGSSLKEQMDIDNNLSPPLGGNGNNNTFEVQYIRPKDDQSSDLMNKAQAKKKTLNKIQPKRYRKGKSFMTDVGLIKQRKGIVDKEDDGYMKCVNEKVDEIINNIQDIDDHSNIVRLNDNAHLSKVEREGRDLRQLLNDIDECKNQMHEDFDEVKYLIKFADNTHKLIGRHKNVMTNIFKEAGLRPKIDQYEENAIEKLSDNKIIAPNSRKTKRKKGYADQGYDEDEAGDLNKSRQSYYNSDKDDNLGEVFNKLKKINKIKDNLCNIQDDFFGYHQRLKEKIKSKH